MCIRDRSLTVNVTTVPLLSRTKSGKDNTALAFFNLDNKLSSISNTTSGFGIVISFSGGEIIIDAENLKRGDLVFFFDTYEVDRIITSVGLYLGEGAFLNSSTNEGVSESDINDPYYWKDKFFFGTRIFK